MNQINPNSPVNKVRSRPARFHEGCCGSGSGKLMPILADPDPQPVIYFYLIFRFYAEKLVNYFDMNSDFFLSLFLIFFCISTSVFLSAHICYCILNTVILRPLRRTIHKHCQLGQWCHCHWNKVLPVKGFLDTHNKSNNFLNIILYRQLVINLALKNTLKMGCS